MKTRTFPKPLQLGESAPTRPICASGTTDTGNCPRRARPQRPVAVDSLDADVPTHHSIDHRHPRHHNNTCIAMNSLNALGNRQVASLNADLQRMEAGEGGSNIQGECGVLQLSCCCASKRVAL